MLTVLECKLGLAAGCIFLALILLSLNLSWGKQKMMCFWLPALNGATPLKTKLEPIMSATAEIHQNSQGILWYPTALVWCQSTHWIRTIPPWLSPQFLSQEYWLQKNAFKNVLTLEFLNCDCTELKRQFECCQDSCSASSHMPWLPPNRIIYRIFITFPHFLLFKLWLSQRLEGILFETILV